MVTERIPSYLQSLLRDLRWILRCPPLLQRLPAGLNDVLVSEKEFKTFFSFLEDEASLESVAKEIEKEPLGTLSLGRYFEKLIAAVLQHSPNVSDLMHNRVVVSGNRTLGELDFVFRERESGEYIHWEVAIKYYLQKGSGLEDFVGPKAIDRLSRKITHFHEKQLPLLRSAEACEQVLTGIDVKKVKSEILLLGMLFREFSEHTTHSIPQEINPKHRSGWWIRANRIEELRTRGGAWHIYKRRNWEQDCRFALPLNLEPLPVETLINKVHTHFSSEDHALMVSEIELRDSEFVEVSRGFVLAETWPQQEETAQH